MFELCRNFSKRYNFGLLNFWDKLPPKFMTKDVELKQKYYPIEVNLGMTPEEKTPFMVEWYKETEVLWQGMEINFDELRNLIAEKGPPFRDGTTELCKFLQKNKIPLLILSAGLGNVLTEALKLQEIYENEYLHVISNFFKVENGIITGYGCRENQFYIHPFNKNGLGCSNYFKKFEDKHNLILMGDSLGDAKMDEGVSKVKNVLKIGFLYGTAEEINKRLPKYLDSFDIVLVDDQTMDVLRTITELIVEQ